MSYYSHYNDIRAERHGLTTGDNLYIVYQRDNRKNSLIITKYEVVGLTNSHYVVKDNKKEKIEFTLSHSSIKNKKELLEYIEDYSNNAV